MSGDRYEEPLWSDEGKGWSIDIAKRILMESGYDFVHQGATIFSLMLIFVRRHDNVRFDLELKEGLALYLCTDDQANMDMELVDKIVAAIRSYEETMSGHE